MIRDVVSDIFSTKPAYEDDFFLTIRIAIPIITKIAALDPQSIVEV